jgi:hypothetical protein
MENVIAIADSVGARIHEQGAYDSLIVFTEEQLNAFANKTAESNGMVKMYRLARMYYLQDLMTQIASEEPKLLELTDWHSNDDALAQMIALIEEDKA